MNPLALIANKPFLKGAGVVLACIALMIAIAWFKGREEADDRNNQTIGATVEREKTQAATIQNIERANNAAEAIRRDPAARDAECLRYAKNPADC